MRLVLSVAVLVCVVQCLPMSQDELEDFSNFLLKTSSLDIHVKTGADPDDSFDEEEIVSDQAWEESGKFEGDLILNDRQRRLIVENVEGLSRNGLTDSTKRWPNNEVIYFIQREHFTSGQVQAIEAGIEDLARASCVKFRPYKKGDRDAVVIQGSRRGCFSQVGYQGGYQVLNLSGRHPVGRGCFRHGTVVHELLHALGFYHMQSSPDRDDYIDVVWANIVQPARHNFRKYNSFSVSDFGVGYDYDSVLHYSRRAFSSNGQDTLIPKKSGAEIGQRVGLSDKDTQKLNKMYCDADNDAAIQADETPTKKNKNKKKKPKNQPFEGHGIGYHQGKTVVIKLPAAETYKLPNVPSPPVFDFSKTPQVVSPEAGGYRFGEEITYSYKPVTSAYSPGDYDKPEVENVSKNIELQDTKEKENVEPLKDDKNDDSSTRLNDSGEFKPKYVPIDDYDKDLDDAFDRLTKIVKQHVYPKNSNYDSKINKDYSNFLRPIKPLSSQINSDIDERFDKTVSNNPPKPDKLENPTDNRIQLQDKMDTSYRTVVPTKRPYSSYEQTETPHYATLEYLKNRHDYSDVYAPKSPYSIEDKDENSKENKDYIKIDPYGHGFYTDTVAKYKTGSQAENNGKEEKPLKYVQEENPNEQSKEKIESSYRTILPTPKPYSVYEDTETPKYATLDYLKDRHDISDVYSPKNIKDQNKNEKEPYTIEDPPTDSDWYTKDYYKHNPANYDRDSYSGYVQKKQNSQIKDESDSNEEVSKGGSSNKPKAEYTSADEEKSNSAEISSEYKQPKYADDYDYYAKYQKGDNDGPSNDNEYNSNESNSKPKDDYNSKAVKYEQHYPQYYDKESSRSEEISHENNRVSPKSQAYKLYGVYVPTTNDWYKVSYKVPESQTVEKSS